MDIDVKGERIEWTRPPQCKPNSVYNNISAVSVPTNICATLCVARRQCCWYVVNAHRYLDTALFYYHVRSNAKQV